MSHTPVTGSATHHHQQLKDQLLFIKLLLTPLSSLTLLAVNCTISVVAVYDGIGMSNTVSSTFNLPQHKVAVYVVMLSRILHVYLIDCMAPTGDLSGSLDNTAATYSALIDHLGEDPTMNEECNQNCVETSTLPWLTMKLTHKLWSMTALQPCVIVYTTRTITMWYELLWLCLIDCTSSLTVYPQSQLYCHGPFWLLFSIHCWSSPTWSMAYWYVVSLL